MDKNCSRNQVFCHFLKFGLLVILEIPYNDSLQQCVTLSRGEIHDKNIWNPNLGQRGQKRSQNQGFFCHFLKFGQLVFLRITYNDGLQKFLTSSRNKTFEKKFLRPKLGQNEPKLGPKLVFLSFFQVWFITFSGNCIGRQLGTLCNYQQR